MSLGLGPPTMCRPELWFAGGEGLLQQQLDSRTHSY